MRAIATRAPARWALAIVALVACQFAAGRENDSRGSGELRSTTSAAPDKVNPPNSSGVANTLKAAAEAVGLARWSGVGGQRLPEVDVINTMEIWGSGTTYGLDRSYKPGEPWPAFKTEYHAALGYNPAAMRVETTRTPAEASATGGATPRHTIEVVRDPYAWDESEIGAGLIPGKGVATPVLGAVKSRILQLWILPYGVIKAALAAGDKATLSTEKGASVISFPLAGELSGVTVNATLDGQNMVVKVESRTNDPALADLNTETLYSDYADHGEIATDIKSPGHIVQKQNGHPLLDIKVKTVDANNPYLVFPVPENVKKAAGH